MITNPLIARLRLLTRLDERDLASLERACAPVRKVPAHQSIVLPGEPSSSFHVLLQGWAARYKLLSDGRRQYPALFLPGDVCDLDGLLLPHNHSGVCALTPCVVATIPHVQLRGLVDENPAIRDAFWWLGCLENAISTEWSLGLGRRSADEHLAHLLCEIFVRLDAVGLCAEDGYVFPLTQVQLADALGLSAVHINRMLRRLQEHGVVSLSSRRLKIHDHAALKRICGFDAGYLYLDGPRRQPETASPGSAAGSISFGDRLPLN